MIVLTIMDGWGYAPPGPGNAIALARKPVYDRMLREYPSTLLHTSGPAVGLPEGQMGNSEVGHLNIGAGRIVQMDITRIDRAIADGSLAHNPALVAAMHHARTRTLHLLGLASDGGVHSHLDHLYALLRMAKAEGVTRVYVHAFTDGRDTAPHSGRTYVEQMEQKMREYGVGQIATIAGRYYAMDRDQRWDRIRLALDAMAHGAGPKAESAVGALTASYEAGLTDEFVLPTVITKGTSDEPIARIGDDDAVIFFNFRADRARQMTRALTRAGEPTPELEKAIPRTEVPKRLHYVCFTRYDKSFDLPLVLPPESLGHILAQVMAERGLRNLRVAETEKYAHVTYFFNGGVETAFAGEERKMIPSPKVATYDLKPEMSAAGVAATVVEAIEKGPFDLVVVNFANADMVGHSGKIPPTIRAVETVDGCLGEIEAALRRRGGSMLVTADHGNAEEMIIPSTGGPHTYHTTNPVPLIAVGESRRELRPGGSLRDLAPTLLGMLGVEEPPEMTGHDLRIIQNGQA
ncbi:MAG TPA: 2,3-bisphosphoglycerate-independent phosphoglycerate mutase [Terriglobales bacterium]|nr:2,3-bisphosphoglycerate-independent phosphoglycerate mutase [Terriglobales bacterium]